MVDPARPDITPALSSPFIQFPQVKRTSPDFHGLYDPDGPDNYQSQKQTTAGPAPHTGPTGGNDIPHTPTATFQ